MGLTKKPEQNLLLGLFIFHDMDIIFSESLWG